MRYLSGQFDDRADQSTDGGERYGARVRNAYGTERIEA